MHEVRYHVPEVSCSHCVESISGEVRKVSGVTDVAVDLDTKLVTVRGDVLDDLALRAAIDEAGYQVSG
jgi:copper chaperone CopZ